MKTHNFLRRAVQVSSGRSFVLALLATAAIVMPHQASAQTVTEVPVNAPHAYLQEIAEGGNNNMIFTIDSAASFHAIGMIDRQNNITTYPVVEQSEIEQLRGAFLGGLSMGPGGSIFSVERSANLVLEITRGGATIKRPLPTPASAPVFIAAGPDATMWITQRDANKIARLKNGQIVEFSIPTPNSKPAHIVRGPNGKMYFTQYATNKIGMIDMAGNITEFTVPTPNSNPYDITLGGDGNLWFTEYATGKIGKMTPSGVFTEYAVPGAGAWDVFGITAAPNRTIAFTMRASNKVGAINVNGSLAWMVAVPTPNASPTGIAAGLNRSVYYVNNNGGPRIGIIDPP